MPFDLSIIPYSIDLGIEILNALIRFMNWDGLRLPTFYIALYRRLRNWFTNFIRGRISQDRRGQLPGWVRDDIGTLVRGIRDTAPNVDNDVYRFDRSGENYIESYRNDYEDDDDDYHYRRY